MSFWNWEWVFRIGNEFLELGVRFSNWECVYKLGVSFGIRSALVGHRTNVFRKRCKDGQTLAKKSGHEGVIKVMNSTIKFSFNPVLFLIRRSLWTEPKCLRKITCVCARTLKNGKCFLLLIVNLLFIWINVLARKAFCRLFCLCSSSNTFKPWPRGIALKTCDSIWPWLAWSCDGLLPLWL